ncbi:hypothetical protein DPMN_153166 [Dreissena polymorpha]|uniref:Uncharacterized protein n=1 Tax=Dreissena polymorpha TaxID=45954 RepID=A0A9D4FIU5_DREPO|nr:hypothetical protein DPMN_153166 [Dreissena polymorpha]
MDLVLWQVMVMNITVLINIVNKIYEDGSSSMAVERCAVSPSGDKIYVTNYDNHKLLTLARDGTVISTFNDPELQHPQGVNVTPAGQVLVWCQSSHTVIQVDREGRKKIATEEQRIRRLMLEGVIDALNDYRAVVHGTRHKPQTKKKRTSGKRHSSARSHREATGSAGSDEEGQMKTKKEEVETQVGLMSGSRPGSHKSSLRMRASNENARTPSRRVFIDEKENDRAQQQQQQQTSNEMHARPPHHENVLRSPSACGTHRKERRVQSAAPRLTRRENGRTSPGESESDGEGNDGIRSGDRPFDTQSLPDRNAHRMYSKYSVYEPERVSRLREAEYVGPVHPNRRQESVLKIILRSSQSTIIHRSTQSAIIHRSSQSTIIHRSTQSTIIHRSSQYTIIHRSTQSTIIHRSTQSTIIHRSSQSTIIHRSTQSTIIHRGTQSTIRTDGALSVPTRKQLESCSGNTGLNAHAHYVAPEQKVPSYLASEERASFDPERASFDPERASFDPERASFDPERASFDSERASFDPERASFDPEQASFDPERASFDPERASFEITFI